LTGTTLLLMEIKYANEFGCGIQEAEHKFRLRRFNILEVQLVFRDMILDIRRIWTSLILDKY
jgi:hypothetical protein